MKKNMTILSFEIGTTAEFLKIYPVVMLLDKSNYRIVASGQQNNELRELQKHFLVEIDFSTHHSNSLANSITNVFEAVIWGFRYFCVSLWNNFYSKHFSKEERIVVVHGDTLTCLIAACAAYFSRVKVVHVEAGLRSNSLLHPFPEEITRRIVSRIAFLNFAPTKREIFNLEGVSGINLCTFGNTGRDTLFTVKAVKPKIEKIPESFALVSLHRNELFQNREVLKYTFEEIILVSHEISVILICDKRFKVEINGLLAANYKEIQDITVLDKLIFPEFKYLLLRAKFLVTDSGGQQEESAALNLPCLVHRRHTERLDGISQNVTLSHWEKGSIVRFSKLSNFESTEKNDVTISPSKIVAETLKKFI
jgi:UDP-N-acetylglucosamine 2-epimerase (non-hydrolysing)